MPDAHIQKQRLARQIHSIVFAGVGYGLNYVKMIIQ